MKTKVQFNSLLKIDFNSSTYNWLKMISAVLILVLAWSPVHSQKFCKTKDVRSKIMDKVISTRNTGPYHVKVYFHVIRRTNGTGGHSAANVDQVFSILENDFSPHNIFFVWDCTIDYINDTNFFNTQGTSSIFSVNDHSDGVDIYLFPDKPNQTGGNGLAQNIPSAALYVSGNYFFSPFQSLTTSSVTSHEMGHCLGLYHTHANLCGSPELVNGSNCTACGDRICDTPADPGLSFNVNEFTCQWQGSGNDPNGDPYNPDESLIMAYTNPVCMTTFSNGQGQKMRDVLSSVLQNVVTTPLTIGNINGPSNVFCGSYFSINPVPGATSYSWSWQGSCGSVYGSGTSAYLYSTCGFATGGLLCVEANFSCPSASTNLACRTLGLLPCNNYYKSKDDDIELRRNVNQTSIYPNPATDNIFIEINEEGSKQLVLMSSSGNIIESKNIENEKTNFDVSRLNSGVYFIRIQLESGEIKTKKILVNK